MCQLALPHLLSLLIQRDGEWMVFGEGLLNREKGAGSRRWTIAERAWERLRPRAGGEEERKHTTPHSSQTTRQ
jgi:hypothetical protein